MNKSASTLRRFIFLAVLITGGLFAQLFLSNNIRVLSRQKSLLESELLLVKDRLEDKLVQIQKLTSEERISKIAEERLGLVKAEKPFEKIYINNRRARKINQIVEDKYD